MENKDMQDKPDFKTSGLILDILSIPVKFLLLPRPAALPREEGRRMGNRDTQDEQDMKNSVFLFDILNILSIPVKFPLVRLKARGQRRTLNRHSPPAPDLAASDGNLMRLGD
ncbi:MAG TPA: hypothetical protein VM658_05235 [bacterium]|nr:hypothetical protein [bacterium]